jgi:hypothetical protein
MYKSLKHHCPSFHLFIFTFDETTHEILKKNNLEEVTLVSLSEFENPKLLEVKKLRSVGEYCWTCTSFTIDYCLSNYDLPHCTYIDSDLFFYDDPTVLMKEMGNSAVLLTEHRYTAKYDQSSTSGIYCVQFITFMNNREGKLALHWWRDRCLEWCYARFEDGKFGDQKYLDDWPSRFQKVHVLRHLGGGVAPWNVQQYNLFQNEKKWFIRDKESRKIYPMIFFHFHYISFFDDGTVNLGKIYDLGFRNVLNLYKEYLKQIDYINDELFQKYSFSIRTSPRQARSGLYKFAKSVYNRYQRLSGKYNNIRMAEFIKSY